MKTVQLAEFKSILHKKTSLFFKNFRSEDRFRFDLRLEQWGTVNLCTSKMAENGLKTILRKWSAPKLIPLNQIP